MPSLTKRNIEKNRGILEGDVKAQELDWFQPLPTLDPKPDVILVADCVWTRQLVQPLLSTLSTLLCDPDTTTIYISYQRRGKDTHDAFTTGLQDRFVVDTMDIKGVSESPLPEEKFFIFRCQHWDGAVRRRLETPSEYMERKLIKIEYYMQKRSCDENV